MPSLLDKINDGTIEHVVVLMQENRSFDEYFGTFPGATGLEGVSESQAANAWPNYLPFRMSTFTSPWGTFSSCDHSWRGQHASWRLGNMSGWNAYNPLQGIGYFKQDDVPFHWWLAQNFLLCDHNFCSVLGPTIANRLYMMSGTAVDPRVSPTSAQWPANADNWAYSGNPNTPSPPYYGGSPSTGGMGWIVPTWNTYADCLTAAGMPSWKVYDLHQDSNPTDNLTQTLSWDLNALAWFPSTWSTMFPSGFPPGAPSINSAHFAAAGTSVSGLDQFINDINNNTLPTISWIMPPYGYSEHPSGNPWDGALLISSIFEALLANPSVWNSTILILTYDENDGHYDHLPPIVPGLSQATQPTVDSNGVDIAPEFIFSLNNGVYQPIGSGFRVPLIVISPWTFQGGICSIPFDHTSIIRVMEDLTHVDCTTPGSLNTASRNITDWRRATFQSLSAIPVNDAPPAVIPPRPQVGTIQNPLSGATIQSMAAARQQALSASEKSASPPELSPQTWPPVPQSCQLIMTIPSYGQGQVNAQAGASFPNAVMVVVNGFEPDELFDPNALAAVYTIPLVNSATATCQSRVPTITFWDSEGNQVTNITCTNPSIDIDPASLSPPTGSSQPFTFTFSLTFNDPSSTFGSLATGTVAQLKVVATFQVDAIVTSNAELELVTTDDPQFYHNFDNETFYLSGELLVFSLTAGDSIFGLTLTGSSGSPATTGPADALNFITNVLTALNNNQGTIPGLPSSAISSFDQLNQLQGSISLPLYPMDNTKTPPLPIFNFGLARVHMQAESSDPAMVRVFFRSFRASTTATGYETNNAYRYDQVAPGWRVPLLGKGEGIDTGEYATIPFFASTRINVSQPNLPMTQQQIDSPNVQLVQTGVYGVPNGGTVEAYFGCWLDINQTTQYNPNANLFPITQPTDPTLIDGPFPADTTLPIQAAFLNDLHQCLIAEISFYTPATPITDDDFFPPQGDNPEYSAWLAQRNLSLNSSNNPGVPASRRVMSSFDIRRTTLPLAPGVEPDEILFDWTVLPTGSKASIYLPGADAAAIVAAAAARYGSQPFSVVDPHTLQCAARGFTFMPVPASSGNFAGLLTVELPSHIHKGENYVVTVRQITNATAVWEPGGLPPLEPAVIIIGPGEILNWRKVAGTFQLSIPVSTKEENLPIAERNYSILLWIFSLTPTLSRWYPVLQRYLCEFSASIAGMGGDPTTIPPTPTGTWPAPPAVPGQPGARARRRRSVGKIAGLIYDHFGDFAGFVLETAHGANFTFHSREGHVQEVVARAWSEQIRVTVISERYHAKRVSCIILHATPPPL
jgi:phospholipase C